MFNTEVAETQDKNLQTTEFLNPNLPGAQIKNGDGIGGKYENMAKSYGRIADYSANSSVRQKRRTMQPKWPMPRREKRKHSKHSTRHSPKRG